MTAETPSELEIENDALRRELAHQWWENHFEHCGREWPHDSGRVCGWPPPAILQGKDLLGCLDDFRDR